MSRTRKLEGGARVAGGTEPRTPQDGPLVSVITVTKDARHVIADAIESILQQDYSNLEYVVVDGGSTDGTLEVIRSYGSGIDYWVSEPDEGISDAFNKGITLSTGEIIGILNADDRYEPGGLRRAVAEFENDPGLDVVCGSVVFCEGEHRWTVGSRPEALPRRMSVQHPATFVRRSRYEASGAFRVDYDVAMDYELMLRFWMQGARFRQISQAITRMGLGGNSAARWHQGCIEIARAQRAAGIAAGRIAWGYCHSVVDRSLRALLARLGLPGGWRSLLTRQEGV